MEGGGVALLRALRGTPPPRCGISTGEALPVGGTVTRVLGTRLFVAYSSHAAKYIYIYISRG